MIPSEPEHFCLDKLIPEAFPLLVAPPVVCLVHLQKLLCGVILYRSSPSNALPIRVFLGQETGQNRIEPCEGITVVQVHISALCTAVTPSGTFGTQSGNFMTRPRVTQTKKVAHSLSAGASHYHELTLNRFLCSC